jgi:histidine phosphotransfer protein HptB
MKLTVLVDADMAELACDYIKNRIEEYVTLRTLVEGSEFAGIEDIGHRMKGNGKSYGFAELTRIGRDLETAAITNDIGSCKRLLLELESFITNVKVETRAAV